jgi:hypothetical protein
MRTYAHAAVDGDQITRLRQILRVTTNDRSAINALIHELELRRLQAQDAPH